MTKEPKPPSEELDKFLLRLPEGLRDRIKTYAERHGRSMNAEIVRILEREFPAPWSLDTKLTQLLALAEALKISSNTSLADEIGVALMDALEGIAEGRVEGFPDEVRKSVWVWLDEWKEAIEDDWREQFSEMLDDEERENWQSSGKTSKIVRTDVIDIEGAGLEATGPDDPIRDARRRKRFLNLRPKKMDD